MNKLQLSSLATSIITEIKFGAPLARNAKHVKRDYKRSVGLSANASNFQVLEAIGETYDLNNLTEEFEAKLTRYGLVRIAGAVLIAPVEA